MEQLLASGKFSLVETTPVDANLERQLYDEKALGIIRAEAAMNSGNFNALFESATFDPKYAESIATARVGQIISPTITSEIGKKNNAEYLIHGTIINMGQGEWINADLSLASTIGAVVLGLFSRSAAGSLINNGGYSREESVGIAMQCDLRVIRASTGEVVWNEIITALNESTVKVDDVREPEARKMLNELKTESPMYAGLMYYSAQEISKKLIDALDNGKLFVR